MQHFILTGSLVESGVPKISGKMDARETMIGTRVRLIRGSIRWSQSAFAAEIGTTRDQLASIEYGRTPLRFDLAVRICRTFDCRPYWLVNSHGDARPYVPVVLTREDRAKFKANTLLSSVYDLVPSAFEKFRPSRERAACDEEAPIDVHHGIGHYVSTKLKGVRFLNPRDGWSFLHEICETLRLRLEADFSKGLAVRENKLNELATIRYWQTSKSMLETEGATSKPIVDIPKTADKFASVSSEIPTWKQIVGALKRKTSSPGAKAQLAVDLRTSRQNVNKWLSGAGAPSAELTLAVFRWVEEHGGWKPK